MTAVSCFVETTVLFDLAELMVHTDPGNNLVLDCYTYRDETDRKSVV